MFIDIPLQVHRRYIRVRLQKRLVAHKPIFVSMPLPSPTLLSNCHQVYVPPSPQTVTPKEKNTDKTTSQYRHQAGAEGICVKIKNESPFFPLLPHHTGRPGAGVIEPVNEPWQLVCPAAHRSLARSCIIIIVRRHRHTCPTMPRSLSPNPSKLVLDLGNRILDGFRRLAGDAASLGPHALG